MQTLGVIGMEDGAIIAVSDSGERFRIPVDAALRSRLRESPGGGDAPRLSPKEIQAHVRAGMSASEVAALTGASVASIERFVGPVLAERAYMVEAAQRVRVQEDGSTRLRSFGAVMTERLEALAASAVTWTSWKQREGGWIVALSFTADAIEHQARWSFDPKRLVLAAENVEAATISQDGDVTAALTPRLRAVGGATDTAAETAAAGAAGPQVPEPEATAPENGGPEATDSDSAPSAGSAETATESAAETLAGETTPEAGADRIVEPADDVVSVSNEHRAVLEPITPPERPLPSNVIGGRFGSRLTAADDGTRSTTDEDGDRFATDAFDLPADLAEPEPQGTGTRPEPPVTTGVLSSLAKKRTEREAIVEQAATRPLDDDLPEEPFGDEDDEDDEDPFAKQEAPERDVPAQVTRGRFPDALPEPAPREEPKPLKRPRSQRQAPREEPKPDRPPTPAPKTSRPRRGRTTMPSWDEIVYGRDDD